MQQTHPAKLFENSPSSGIPDPRQSYGAKKVYPRDSVRLFKSDFLERFTHVNPIVPLIVWIPVIAFLIYRSVTIHGMGVASLAFFGFLGIFLWTFIEYALHRFVFHYPAKSAFGNRVVYILHGLHHEDPVDPTRLVMPPLPALIYSSLLFSIFRLVLDPAHVEAFMAFFLVGYLGYDYIHFYVHFFNPTSSVGKFLKRYHMKHHFADYEAKWGVSNPLWDYVFGTAESKAERDSASRATTA